MGSFFTGYGGFVTVLSEGTIGLAAKELLLVFIILAISLGELCCYFFLAAN
jgi:hypothetical protein